MCRQDGFEQTAESLYTLLSLRARNAVARLASYSIYSLKTTLKEMNTAQAFILVLFDGLVAEDMEACSLLLDLEPVVEHLKSFYLAVWLREDFNFQKEEVRKVLLTLERMQMKVPDHINRVFYFLATKYGITGSSEDNGVQHFPTDGLRTYSTSTELTATLTELTVTAQPLQTQLYGDRRTELGNLLKENQDLPDTANKKEVKNADKNGYTLVHQLAEARTMEQVEKLIVAAVPSNLTCPKGSTAMHEAAIKGDVEVLKKMLRAGADLCAARDDGNSPLHLAAFLGHGDVVEWLIDHGADLTARNGVGRTALHTAAEGGHTGILRILINMQEEQRRLEGTRTGAIQRGYAGVNLRDNTGCTPLHVAARANRPEALQLLVELGADMSVKNNSGRTPLNEASVFGGPEAERVLLDLGGGLTRKERRKYQLDMF